jgi:exodeoxyribonuclease VII large subunit
MDWFCTPEKSASDIEVKSVSDVSRTIRKLLDDVQLQNIWIEGEIRDYRCPPRGHRYFSLSEQKGTTTYVINCAMWRSFARELAFEPKEGMKVLVWGTVEVYEPYGKYQIIVRDMRLAGAGEKHLMVQQWKNELSAEGLFDASRKIALPRFPLRVGIVTSPSGAARHDIENVISRRFPVELILSPTAVQGEGAHREIADAIRRIDGNVDVIIVGRGGGSYEDLFAFNHPDVVRAIAACRTPVVSAVGHEVDVSLADFAADYRAPTPSAAAEIVVPDRLELATELKRCKGQLQSSMEKHIIYASQKLEDLRLRLQPRRFVKRLEDEMQWLFDFDERLTRSMDTHLRHEQLKIGQIKATIEGMDPKITLALGYCIVKKEGQVISKTGDLFSEDMVSIQMVDGNVTARIEEVHHDTKQV